MLLPVFVSEIEGGDNMINVIDEKSFVATRIITAKNSNGIVVEVVSLYSSVELDKLTSFNFTILNKELYEANKDAIKVVVEQFKAEITAKIDEMGGLQF